MKKRNVCNKAYLEERAHLVNKPSEYVCKIITVFVIFQKALIVSAFVSFCICICICVYKDTFMWCMEFNFFSVNITNKESYILGFALSRNVGIHDVCFIFCNMYYIYYIINFMYFYNFY